MKKNILFSFENAASISRSKKQVVKYFVRAGVNVVSAEVNPTTKRTSGVSYREMSLAMSDSQTVIFRVRTTGDIFQVRVNGRVKPIMEQEDHVKAVAEIARSLDASRTAFQKRLARAKTRLPPSVRTAAPRMEAVLVEKRDALKEALDATLEEIEKVNAS